MKFLYNPYKMLSPFALLRVSLHLEVVDLSDLSVNRYRHVELVDISEQLDDLQESTIIIT